MKKIMFLAFATTIALVIFACDTEQKSPEVEPIPEPEEEVDPSISEADRNWVYNYPSRHAKSPNFVINYISPKAFAINFDQIIESDLDFSNCPPPLDAIEWQNRKWNADSVLIIYRADRYAPNAVISAERVDPDLAGEFINPQPALFNPIAKHNNDTTYNDTYWDRTPYMSGTAKYINLTCDRDYDAEHPKGALLNDIVKIDYYTAKPFIDSKYKNRRLGDHDKSRTVELLRDFNTKQVGMLRYDLNFRLTTAPQTPGLYRFIFTYCDDTGSEISATTEQINLQARQ